MKLYWSTVKQGNTSLSLSPKSKDDLTNKKVNCYNTKPIEQQNKRNNEYDQFHDPHHHNTPALTLTVAPALHPSTPSTVRREESRISPEAPI